MSQTASNIGTINQRLSHLAFVVVRQSDQVLQERLGIGFSQFKIMMVLQRHAGIQQRAIADSLGQTEASISRQIKLLQEQGLLITTVNPENRRMHITTLSAKGARLADEAVSIVDSFNQPLVDNLSEKQQTALLDMLDEMHEQACAAGRLTACHHTEANPNL